MTLKQFIENLNEFVKYFKRYKIDLFGKTEQLKTKV